MEKTIEFEFEGVGRLCLELLKDGDLQIRLQAQHPGEGWRVTSTTVAIDQTKVEALKIWLSQIGGVE
jgi:hypothetical protein